MNFRLRIVGIVYASSASDYCVTVKDPQLVMCLAEVDTSQ